MLASKLNMRRIQSVLVFLVVCSVAVAGAVAQTAIFPKDVSFRNEVQRAIDRGFNWFQKNQNTNGFWSTADQPAVTALVLTACKGDPNGRFSTAEPDWVKKGYSFLLSNVKPDGSIYPTNLVTYNTALCMMALVAANKPDYDPVLRKARTFLVRLQRGSSPSPVGGERAGVRGPEVFDGGIGYGTKYEHSDMGNTSAALEALYYTKHLVQDKKLADMQDLNWDAAIQFLQNCQNLPAYNKQSWASDDPKNKGGFVYYPGHSMAGSETNANGRVALRSYGSISYAGLLSYIHCDLKRDDPRVAAVFDWLQKNYTLEENPGMGPQGLFYYFHTMSKALSLYGADTLPLANGQKVDWRRDLAMKLINLQQRDGSWENTNGRWWEKDPALVTAYAVLTLERLHRQL
jgi:squalene-hopene/tetraprenyl-beta-curcumene cyclase